MMKKNLKLTIEEVKHVARLANLTLTENEIGKFQKQLSEIISYINKLNELDTRKTDPASQVTGLVNVLREDKIDTSRMLSRIEVLRNARSKTDNVVKVKSIFE